LRTLETTQGSTTAESLNLRTDNTGESMKTTGISRRALRIVGVVAVSTSLLSACGAVDGPSASSGGNANLPVVKFGATQNPSSIGTVAALIKKEGLDTKCGVNIESSAFSPDAADIALLSGQTNVGYFGYNSWAGSAEKTKKLALLGPLQAEHGTLFVPNDSPAHSLQDLKGKKIALLPPVSGQYQDFNLLVAKMGMSLKNDFKPVTGPPPAIEAFLKRGEVDAAIIFEPNATKVDLGGGYRPIFKLTDQWKSITGEPLYMLGISANRAWLKGHEKEARCVVTAVHEATKMLANDPTVYKELKDVLGVTDDAQLKEYAKNLGAIYTPQTADEAKAAIQNQLQEAQKLGLISTVPDPIFTPLGK
jgi:ABC-type nitrate/sulfonate/bicarbonate transport system substrate-binding protein